MSQIIFLAVGICEMYAFIWASAESDAIGAVACATALVLTVGLQRLLLSIDNNTGGPRYGI